MPAIAEKGGLERLIERGLICKAHCDPCRIFYSDNKILNVIADQEKISRELGR